MKVVTMQRATALAAASILMVLGSPTASAAAGQATGNETAREPSAPKVSINVVEGELSHQE
ncbi:MAG: hypothetical protein ACREEY_16620, partial [Brevundimonas sp.]